MKKCELCNSVARMFCDSDRAILCWDCDARVHAANFLVAKHSRTLLCHACQSPTPWSGTGPRLGPTVSVCDRCAQIATKSSDDEDDDDESQTDSDESDGGDDEEGDEGDNQVVPPSFTPLDPPPVSSSSSGEDSSPGRFRNRRGVFGSRSVYRRNGIVEMNNFRRLGSM